MAVGDRQWWTAVMNGSGRGYRTVDKVNEEIIKWCEMRRYKIVGKKIKMK